MIGSTLAYYVHYLSIHTMVQPNRMFMWTTKFATMSDLIWTDTVWFGCYVQSFLLLMLGYVWKCVYSRLIWMCSCIAWCIGSALKRFGVDVYILGYASGRWAVHLVPLLRYCRINVLDVMMSIKVLTSKLMACFVSSHPTQYLVFRIFWLVGSGTVLFLFQKYTKERLKIVIPSPNTPGQEGTG